MTELAAGSVVRLDEDDAQGLHELLAQSWGETYAGLLPDDVIRDAETIWHSAETLRRQMKNRTVLFAGCKRDGRILGMMRAAMTDPSTMRVFQLFVLASEQGRGVGTELMRYARGCFPEAKRLVLDVPKGNERAIVFFQKYGFGFAGESTLRLGSRELQNLEGTMEV